MKRVLLALALCGLAACGTPTESTGQSEQPKSTQAPKPKATEPERPGIPEVYARIAKMTNCDQLQEQFDIAAANHDRDSDRGRLDLAEIDTAYMTAADDRMREVDCYK